jgi:hypothetical protein
VCVEKERRREKGEKSERDVQTVVMSAAPKREFGDSALSSFRPPLFFFFKKRESAAYDKREERRGRGVCEFEENKRERERERDVFGGYCSKHTYQRKFSKGLRKREKENLVQRFQTREVA